MKHQKMKTTLLLALTLALALPIIAEPQRGSRGNCDSPREMRAELNLTEIQEKQMQDLRFDRELNMIDLRAKLQTEHLTLRKLRQADEPNKKKLYAQVEKVGAVKIKMDKSKVDHQLAVRKVLTEDQFKIFARTMQNNDGRGKARSCDQQSGPNKRPHRDRF